MIEHDKVNILMVDDQPAKLLAYESILGELGENLIKAGSGREALEQLLATDIAVVLMDVSMPELDGFELAEIIHRHPRYEKTAIIFVSAVHLTDLDQLNGYERGAVDYISVPVNPELLRAKVSVFAELYRKTQQVERLNRELEKRVAERTEELQRRADELQRLNAELERSNRDLDAFAYIASHDLKEPLRGIHSLSNFLLEDYSDKLDEAGVNQLGTVMRLTRRMESLIESLLHFSHVGRADMAMETTDLQEVVADTLEVLAARLEEGHVEVRIPAPLPTVRADRVRVGEIFHNLVANAVKYNDHPEKWVEIGCASSPGQDGAMRQVFYVRDNGIGVAEQHHEAVFRIFRRLHGREEYGGGTGAGLTIVRMIVERHGGSIWIDSEPGAGSTFYFTLGKSGEDTHAETASDPAD
jgi:signal transduction histidine kinase